MCVFIFFVFSCLGMGMLYLSQVYLKLSAYKKNSLILEFASENGIKQNFDQFYILLSQNTSPLVLSEEEEMEFREDSINKGTKIIQKLLASEIPLIHESSWDKMSWKGCTNFSLDHIQEKSEFFRVTYRVEIQSTGFLKNFKQTKDSTLELAIGISAGKVPLAEIPVLIDKELTPEQKNAFLAENKIDFFPIEGRIISPAISFSSENLLPKDASSQLSSCLKVDVFHPQSLSTPQLRTALGLEESNEPVPEGVYLIRDDLGLGGIYIVGDMEEMVLAIQGDFQIISFRSGQRTWVLKFSPLQKKTIFSTPDETFAYDQTPQGIIVIDGKIHSLGGGVLDSAGNPILIKEEEIPCLLQGVNLTIIASDKITLSSHIIHQGLKWEQGIPYVKGSNSQLNVFATGQGFLDNSEKEGQIVIADDAPQDIKIQASLTASGKGFSVEGENKKVNIIGSLHASDLNSNNNTLQVAFDERFLEIENLLQNSPKSSKPVLNLSSLQIIEWKETL